MLFGAGLRRWLPHHLFVYILGRGFFATALAVASAGALAAGGPTTVIRVQRLSGRSNSRLLGLAAYLGAAAILVLPTIAIAVPWLTELHRLFWA
jgi:hypothetical protein